MYKKFINKLNLYWGLISLIFVVAVVSLILTVPTAKDDAKFYITDIVVELLIGMSLFWGVYILGFLFKRNKYPFITCESFEMKGSFLKFTAYWKWFWVIFIPILIALLVPLIYFLCSLGDPEANHIIGQRFGILFGVVALVSLNNLAYIYVLLRRKSKMNSELETIF